MTDGPVQGLVPPALCLDLSRLVSRVGRGAWTGIDRVEAAWLHELLARPNPVFALVRTSLGHVLLDREGMAALEARLRGGREWGPPDLVAKALGKGGTVAGRVESDLRRLAVARAPTRFLTPMLRRRLPAGTVWLNVGHTDLSAHVFNAVHAVERGRAVVMVHDVIPLDHPEYQRPGTVERFESRMRMVSARADKVIYVSQASRDAAERWFDRWGRVPPGQVAHIGVDRPEPSGPPPVFPMDPARPVFTCLGTIEPRKNHAILLDTWEALAAERAPGEIPQLVLAGNRGWANEALFARLDTSPLVGRDIHELAGLDDNALAHLLLQSRALLFPSLAEGFGLPPVEAMLLGVPAVVGDLPVYRETVGDNPIYADVQDMYSWKKVVEQLSSRDQAQQSKRSGPFGSQDFPNWPDHFNRALSGL